VRPGRRPGVPGAGPGRLAVQLDALQCIRQVTEQPGGVPRRDADPLGEVLRRGRAVYVQVARDQGTQGGVAVGGAEAGQPAVRVGVRDLAAPVRPEAEHPAVPGSTGELAPARPLVLECVHSPLDGPRARPVRERLGQLVDGQLGVRQRVPDGRDDLVGLTGSEAHALGVDRYRRRQGRQRPGPHRQVSGGEQVNGAARAERLDQGALLPERVLHTGAGCPRDTPRDGKLSRAEHLGMRAAEPGGDAGRVEICGRFGQRVPVHPPGGDAGPGQSRGHERQYAGRAARGSGSAPGPG